MGFSFLLKIAFNNIRRYKFQSCFIFAALIISQSSLIISLSIINGFNNEFIRNFLKFEPDIRIFEKKESSFSFIPNSPDLLKKIISPGIEFSATLETEGVLKANGFVAGIKVLGIDTDQSFYKFSNILKHGQKFTNENGFICGHRLAKKMSLIPGKDRAKIVTSDGESYFNLTGVFQTGLSDYDTYYIFVDRKRLSTMMDIPDTFASFIDLRYNNKSFNKSILETIKAYRSETLQKRNAALFLAAKVEKIAAFIIISFMIIISVLLIISLFLFQIMKLKKEIAFLKVIGYTNLNIMNIFNMQIIIFYIVSTLITLIFSSAVLYYLTVQKITLPDNVYLLSNIPIFISLGDIAGVLIFTFVCIIGGTVIPLRILQGINPSIVISGRDDL
ncbi:ABC transporter permease [bacterium]|nr:ABC transporter permease [bacterium]